MLYKNNIVQKEITKVVNEYLKKGYFLNIKDRCYNDICLINDDDNELIIGRDYHLNEIEEDIYSLIINVFNYKNINIKIDTGIKFTLNAKREFVYSNDIEEVRKIRDKVKFRRQHQMLDVDYVGFLAVTNIKGFKKNIKVTKHINDYDDRHIVTAFITNKNGRNTELYQSYGDRVHLGYKLEFDKKIV